MLLLRPNDSPRRDAGQRQPLRPAEDEIALLGFSKNDGVLGKSDISMFLPNNRRKVLEAGSSTELLNSVFHV